MSKTIERVKLWTPLDHAKVTLATFDERGKCKDKVESENYVTDVLQGQFQWFARKWLSSRCGITSPVNDTGNNQSQIDWTFGYGIGVTVAPGINTDYQPGGGSASNVGPWPTSVVLTSASHAVDTVNDRYLRGALIGWSYAEGYSGSDTKRGGINGAECLIQPTKTVFVFDWPTSAGNGTIQSVYWANVGFNSSTTAPSGNYAQNAEHYLQNATSTGWSNATAATWSNSFPSGLAISNNGLDVGLYLDPDGTHFWTTYSTQQSGSADTYVVQRSLYTGAVVTQLRLTGSGQSTIIGMCNDGTSSVGNWWTYSNAGNLQKWPAAGGSPTSTTSAATLGIPSAGGVQNTSTCMFMQPGTTFLWLCSGGGNKIYQIQTTGPTLANTLTLPTPNGASNLGISTGNQAGMYYPDSTNGDELWICIGGQTIFRFDTSGNWRGSFYLPVPTTQPPRSGMASWPGGGYICHWSQFSGSTETAIMSIVNNSRQFLTRSLLPSAITKSNTQTMKLTYEFDYT